QTIRKVLVELVCRVTSEQRVPVVPLIINPADDLLMILLIATAVSDQTTFIQRCGRQIENAPCNVHSRWTEPRRIDAIAGERSSQIEGYFCVTRRSSKGCPVTRQHPGRRHKRLLRGLLPDGGSLEACKEEKFILHDRAAERAAKLVALQIAVLRREIALRSE